MKWMLEHKLCLLDSNNTEVGYALISETNTSNSHIFNIVSIYVAEQYRSIGLARKLLFKALDFILNIERNKFMVRIFISRLR